MFSFAYEYYERGLNVIPLSSGSKVPPPGFDLKQRFSKRCTEADVRNWFADESLNPNIGIVTGHTSGVVAIDVDNIDDARELYKRLPKTEMMTITGKGVHLIYQIRSGDLVRPRVKANVRGVKADIRGENSYVVAAPSVHPSGAKYRKHGRWELVGVPFFSVDWIQDVDLRGSPFPRQKRIGDPMAYISKIHAVSGSGGHKATFRAACVLRDAGLSAEESLAALIEWNQAGNAVPQWSIRELLHKVRSVYRSESR